MANILSKYVPGMQATAEVNRRLGGQPQLIATGKAYIAFSWPTRPGRVPREDKFRGNPGAAAHADGPLSQPMHVVTVEGSGVAKMSDLKGRRVSTVAGSATGYGVPRDRGRGSRQDKDMTRERLASPNRSRPSKDRKIGRFFWVGGLRPRRSRPCHSPG